MELLSGQKTLNELADQYQIAPATLSNWHKQFQERAAEVFQKGPSNKERELSERDQEIAVLQQKVGQLLIERDWLKKNLMKFSAPTDGDAPRYVFSWPKIVYFWVLPNM
jgi:putative transposase